jgi:hypothetical protein
VVNPITKIGRRIIFLSTQQSTLRRNLSDLASSSFSPLPFVHKMTSSGGSGRSGSTRGASSYQPLASSVIGNFYSHQILVQSSTNPAKVITKDGLFKF